MGNPNTSPAELRSFVERIQRLDEENKQICDDRKDVYTEAKSKGFDVPALKRVIAYLRRDPADAAAADLLFETYLANVNGTERATRTRGGSSGPVALATAAAPIIAKAADDLDIPGFLRRDLQAGAP